MGPERPRSPGDRPSEPRAEAPGAGVHAREGRPGTRAEPRALGERGSGPSGAATGRVAKDPPGERALKKTSNRVTGGWKKAGGHPAFMSLVPAPPADRRRRTGFAGTPEFYPLSQIQDSHALPPSGYRDFGRSAYREGPRGARLPQYAHRRALQVVVAVGPLLGKAASCVLSTGFEQKSHLDLSSSVTDVSMENRAGQACCMSALRTRYDSPRNLRSRPWCTTRSITAAAIWSSPKTWPHRENSRLVVITTDCLS